MNMTWNRFFSLALFPVFLALASAAHSTPAPLLDFKDIRVEKPTTPKRVKQAIVRAALSTRWDVVEEPDGSLLVSKADRHAVKVRLSYDAAKYSLSYLSSVDLDFTTEAGIAKYKKMSVEKEEAESLEKFKDSPDTPFTVKTTSYIDDDYEDYVRALLDSIRRYVEAPDF